MINISIVIYKNSLEEIKKAIAPYILNKHVSVLCICDNSEIPQIQKNEIEIIDKKILFIARPDNPGYGKGHNYSYLKCKELNPTNTLHLFVNLDVAIESHSLTTLIEAMHQNNDTVQMMPKILNTDGSIQRLCKRLPSPVDVFVRRFLPNCALKQKINNVYTLKEYNYQYPLNCPYLSGCFMLVRCRAFEEINGFDERFFMYPEDIDLTRRLHKTGKTLCWPYVSVIHQHGKASYSSLRMTVIHTKNMIRYFNKWGWIYDKQKNLFNKNLRARIQKECLARTLI